MSLHTFVRFEATAGKTDQLRNELLALMNPTRAEPGCLEIHLYEETSACGNFQIHSCWRDEAAFDGHVKQPPMVRFLALVGELAANQIKALRTKQID